MTELDERLSGLESRHRAALHWFHERAGEVVSWPRPLPDATLLSSKAKGIYKPAWTRYALSVRQNLVSQYADREPVTRSDGTWSYRYFQENPDPNKRDDEYTNRGLLECLNDRVPVGVMRQVEPKPAPRYRVLGVAMVVDWEEGYFLLEGFSPTGQAVGTATEALVREAEEADNAGSVFDPSDLRDGRQRTIAAIVRRRGQPAFRRALLKAYQGKCAITGCDAERALEAAHIVPYMGAETNHVTNGLLLRADIHTLFDLGLIAVEPNSMTLLLSPALRETSYRDLEGTQIRLPRGHRCQPDESALGNHRLWSGL